MEISEITQRIESKLPGAEVYLRDLTGGGNHFEAFVISKDFEGKNRLTRQRIVMESLAELLRGADAPLHAITFKTYTPQEWETSQNT
jgi:acid stress-induced BolA-like protein IbaG/YrbA